MPALSMDGASSSTPADSDPYTTTSALVLRSLNFRRSRCLVLPILPDPSAAPLYSVEWHNRRPHLQFFSHPTGTPFATVNYHAWTYKIDITFCSANEASPTFIQLRPQGILDARRITYESPALSGAQIQWVTRGRWRRYWACFDADNVQLATATYGRLPTKDRFGVDFAGEVDGRDDGGALKNELTVIGVALAILLYKIQQRSNSTVIVGSGC